LAWNAAENPEKTNLLQVERPNEKAVKGCKLAVAGRRQVLLLHPNSLFVPDSPESFFLLDLNVKTNMSSEA